MLQFTVNRDIDPDGASLRTLLEAHFRYERMGAVKSLCLHLLAVVGVVVWSEAAWPAFLPAGVEVLALALWGVLLLLTVWAGLEERAWRRKVEHYRREHQAEQRGDAR